MANWASGLIDWVDRRSNIIGWLINGAIWLVSIGLPAWAVYYWRIFQDYAPVSWIAAGFVGLLFISIVYFFIGKGKWYYQLAKRQSRISIRSPINPLDSNFYRQRIWIVDLAPPVIAVVQDKSFSDCDLIGPANVLFGSCTFQGNAGEAVDGLIIKAGSVARNGIMFIRCNFTRCRFYHCTFMVPELTYHGFETHGWDGVNWLTNLPNSQPAIPKPQIDSPPPEDTAEKKPQ